MTVINLAKPFLFSYTRQEKVPSRLQEARSVKSVTAAEMADIEVEKLQAIVTLSTTEDDGEEMLGEELSQKHPFHWETIRRDPKGDHPSVCTRRNWYKTMTYSMLDTNGFLLLFTMRGRVYWVTQNTTTHTTPDWKLHFSIIEEDIPRAWNILAKLFMEKKCDIGMKVTTNATRFCASSQRGREITVYLYVYDPRLKSGVMYQPPSPDSEIETFIGETEDDNIENQVHLLFIDSKNPTNNVFARDHIVLDQFPSFTESDFYLGPEFEGIYSPTFWHEFIVQAEERLSRAGKHIPIACIFSAP